MLGFGNEPQEENAFTGFAALLLQHADKSDRETKKARIKGKVKRGKGLSEGRGPKGEEGGRMRGTRKILILVPHMIEVLFSGLPTSPVLRGDKVRVFLNPWFGEPVVCTLDSRGFRLFRGFRDFRESSTQLLDCSSLSCLRRFRRFRDFRRFRERRAAPKP